MNKEDILHRMTTAPVRTELDSRELSQLEEMIKSDAFLLYCGLLFGSKQAQLVGLANCRLGTSELSCAASVMQGTIKGIDLALQSFVDLFPNAGSGAE